MHAAMTVTHTHTRARARTHTHPHTRMNPTTYSLNQTRLILTPSNSHVIQPNDQRVHSQFKSIIRQIQLAVSKVWDNRHAYIDRDRLMRGEVVVEYTAAGLTSVPGSGKRNPNMKHREWRAAHFHDTPSASPVFNQRDLVVAAVWCWERAITKQHVLASYRTAMMYPFVADGWKPLSEAVSKRQAAADTKVLPGTGRLVTKSLRSASRRYHDIDVPQPADPSSFIGTKRVRLESARRADRVLADEMLSSALKNSQTMDGVARLQYLHALTSQWMGRRRLTQGKADIITGAGAVEYQEEVSDFDPAANRSRAGKGGPLLNLTSGRKSNTGRWFSPEDVRRNRGAAKLAAAAASGSGRKKADDARAASKHKTAVAKKARAAEAAAITHLDSLTHQLDELSQELHGTPMTSPGSAVRQRPREAVQAEINKVNALKRLAVGSQRSLATKSAKADRSAATAKALASKTRHQLIAAKKAFRSRSAVAKSLVSAA